MQALDKEPTQCLRDAEDSMKGLSTFWWSDTLHRMHTRVKYWAVKVSLNKNCIDGEDILRQKWKKVSIDINIFQEKSSIPTEERNQREKTM
eukprot:7523509-Ditylum_brightwellii.AAC.1